MTTLILSMIRAPAGVQKQTRYVSRGCFQIGRAPSSDWVLDDPHHIVSKRHCVFRQEDGGWSIADMSRNGSFVARGARTLRLGSAPYRLAAGERLRVGSYEISLDLEEDETSFRILMLDGIHPAPLSVPPDVTPVMGINGADHGSPFPDQPTTAGASSSRGSRNEALIDRLRGASLAPEDVRTGNWEREVLRRAGAALRLLVVNEIRRHGTVPFDGTYRDQLAPAAAIRSLVEADTDPEALRWLLDLGGMLDGDGDEAATVLLEAIRQHRERLMRTAHAVDERAEWATRWLNRLFGRRPMRDRASSRGRVFPDQSADEALLRAYREFQRDGSLRPERE